jgi:hypothetical protein
VAHPPVALLSDRRRRPGQPAARPGGRLGLHRQPWPGSNPSRRCGPGSWRSPTTKPVPPRQSCAAARLPLRHPQLRRGDPAAGRRRPASARALPPRARTDPVPGSVDPTIGAAGGDRRRRHRPAGRPRHPPGGPRRLRLGRPRRAGLVSVNGYLIQDISTATNPIRPDLEAGFWYFFNFATERGRRGLAANRRDIAKVIWTRNSPAWHFDDAVLDRAAGAFDNDDYVELVIHSHRHRLGLAPGHAPYDELKRRLADQPPIAVPTITLDGQADATSRPPTAPPNGRTSWAPAPTARFPTPATTSRKKTPKHSPTRSSTVPTPIGRSNERIAT